MSDGGIGLLLDCVRLGALLEQVIREAIDSRALNDTDAWIVIAMSGLTDTLPAAKPEARSATSIAEQLGCARERISVRVQVLVEQGLLCPVSIAAESGDRRRKTYVLTAKGRREAARLFDVLSLLERTIRMRAGLKRNARAVDPQRLAFGLWSFVLGRKEQLRGLDRRRLPARRQKPELLTSEG